MSAIVRWYERSLALPFFGIGMKIDLFQSCGHCWVFQICWHIECSTFTASSSRIWNRSTGVPSPPLALFIVMLYKAHLTSHSGCLALSEWLHHHGYLDHEKAREFQKNIYFCFIDYAKAFDCVDHKKLWKILKEMGRPDHLPLEKPTCRSGSNS